MLRLLGMKQDEIMKFQMLYSTKLKILKNKKGKTQGLNFMIQCNDCFITYV